MILLGDPAPTLPPVLPGLSGHRLLDALRAEQRRLVFMCEHLAHPLVSEGVADAVHDALDALRCAVSLQRDLVAHDAFAWDGTARTVAEHEADA